MKVTFYTALLADLASHGYVVLAVNPTYEVVAVTTGSDKAVGFSPPIEKIIEYEKGRLVVWPAGERFEYSNFGYAVLERAISLAAREPSETLHEKGSIRTARHVEDELPNGIPGPPSDLLFAGSSHRRYRGRRATGL